VHAPTRLINSRWAFPLALLVPLTLMTALRIHGSSIGLYNSYLHGPDYDDPDLIYGGPEPIRSDEWLVATPYIVSQAQNEYPRINEDIGRGQDMSVVVNVPYKEWSVLFKPQNLAFFVLPLENAFAFHWWVAGYLLIVGFYLLVLELAPRRRGFAVLLSLSLFLSPFVQWWYSTSTLLSLALPFLALVVYIRLLNATRAVPRVGLALVLAYLLTSFVLLMYPPFQIACAVAAGFFAIGYLIQHITENGVRKLLGPLGYLGGAIVLAGVVSVVFFATRAEVVKTIANTAYPGDRVIHGGDYEPLFLFSTHLMPLVQSSFRAAQYFSNQSEVSNFFYFSPFLLLPSVYLFVQDRRGNRPIDFALLFVSLGIAVLSLRLVIRGGDWFYRILLLDRVPGNRLLIGLGLLGFVQITLLYRRHGSQNWPTNRFVAWGTGTIALLTFLLAGFEVRDRYPGFISGPVLIVALSLVISTIVLLYTRRQFLLGTMLLLAFSLASVFHIHPLYRGLDPLLNTDLARQLRSIGDRKGAWIVLEDIYLEHQPVQQGLRSFSGVYAYPQLDLWRAFDPEADDVDIYNRFAHVTFSTSARTMELIGPDHFGVPFSGCSTFVRQNRVRHVLSPAEVSDKCLTLERVIPYPSRDLFIYRVVR
jgi:hypothetical protein